MNIAITHNLKAHVVVVDDDIDVSNLEELMWAVCSRSDPATSIDFIRGAWSMPLDPSIPPERKAQNTTSPTAARSSTPAGLSIGRTSIRS